MPGWWAFERCGCFTVECISYSVSEFKATAVFAKVLTTEKLLITKSFKSWSWDGSTDYAETTLLQITYSRQNIWHQLMFEWICTECVQWLRMRESSHLVGLRRRRRRQSRVAREVGKRKRLTIRTKITMTVRPMHMTRARPNVVTNQLVSRTAFLCVIK